MSKPGDNGKEKTIKKREGQVGGVGEEKRGKS
jgi:hypothetical protein